MAHAYQKEWSSETKGGHRKHPRLGPETVTSLGCRRQVTPESLKGRSQYYVMGWKACVKVVWVVPWFQYVDLDYPSNALNLLPVMFYFQACWFLFVQFDRLLP